MVSITIALDCFLTLNAVFHCVQLKHEIITYLCENLAMLEWLLKLLMFAWGVWQRCDRVDQFKVSITIPLHCFLTLNEVFYCV